MVPRLFSTFATNNTWLDSFSPPKNPTTSDLQQWNPLEVVNLFDDLDSLITIPQECQLIASQKDFIDLLADYETRDDLTGTLEDTILKAHVKLWGCPDYGTVMFSEMFLKDSLSNFSFLFASSWNKITTLQKEEELILGLIAITNIAQSFFIPNARFNKAIFRLRMEQTLPIVPMVMFCATLRKIGLGTNSRKVLFHMELAFASIMALLFILNELTYPSRKSRRQTKKRNNTLSIIANIFAIGEDLKFTSRAPRKNLLSLPASVVHSPKIRYMFILSASLSGQYIRHQRLIQKHCGFCGLTISEAKTNAKKQGFTKITHELKDRKKYRMCACGLVRYCCENHQKKHWINHKIICYSRADTDTTLYREIRKSLHRLDTERLNANNDNDKFGKVLK